MELVQGNFGNISLRHKEAGNGHVGVHFFPLLLSLPACIAFDPSDRGPDGATFRVFSCRGGVDDARLYVAPFGPVWGCPHALLHGHADLQDHEFCRTFLACRAGKVAFLEDEVFAAKIAEHVDVVDKRG